LQELFEKLLSVRTEMRYFLQGQGRRRF